jgi:hypothetical protein
LHAAFPRATLANAPTEVKLAQPALFTNFAPKPRPDFQVLYSLSYKEIRVSIHAEGEFTLTDVWSGMMLHARKTALVFAALGVAMLFFATMGSFMGLRIIGGARNELVLAGVGIFWIVYCPLRVLINSRSNLKNPTLQGLARYDFNQEGYTRTNPNSRGELKWSALSSWREGKNTFLFFPSPKSAILIPKRFFKNSADISSLRQILNANVSRK